MVLETLFQASIETEEGRTLLFNFVLTRVEDPLVRQRSKILVGHYEFERPRPFTLQEIRRLAPATNINSTALWADFSEERQELRLIGVADIGESWFSARLGFKHSYWSPPHALMVRVTKPGCLVVYQGEFGVARLESGTIHTGTINPFSALNGLYVLFDECAAHLADRIVLPENPRRDYDPRAFEKLAYFSTVVSLVQAIRGLRHGGTLVVVPRTWNAKGARDVRLKFGVAPRPHPLQSAWIAFVNAMHAWEGGPVFPAKNRQGRVDPLEAHAILANETLAHNAAVVARLGATDGAILLRSDLAVLGFGAELQGAPTPPHSVLLQSDGSDPKPRPMNTEEGGMRHRAAARFAWANQGVAVFAVSQDGGITTFHRGADATYVAAVKPLDLLSAHLLFS